ncbi:MAG: HNH endonuclease [Bdellovibrionaceae bacterium]|nr:HNH endonuclease [Pseudobdellovibrionaceae bacterium]
MDFSTLTNNHLISSFDGLVKNERKITGQILECICEIDKRKIYLEKNYTSLFDYLVKDFGYSAGAAMRRIDGARLLREIPDIGEKFENGSLTLSQATQIQKASRELKKMKRTAISALEKRDLVLKIENSNQKDTAKTIAAVFDLPVLPIQKETFHKNQSVTLTITLTHAQMHALEQAKNMISHSVPSNNWAETIAYLAKKELSRRSGKRLSAIDPTTAAVALKNEKMTAKTREQVPLVDDGAAIEGTFVNSPRHSVRKRRAIPLPLRKKLLHPHATCAHMNSTGVRCLNSRFLQIDHIKSWSRGGSDDFENLQVLCGVHNRLKYLVDKKGGL